MGRRLAFVAGAVGCGLALMAFDVPLPLPSVSPTVPAPLPSVSTLLGGSSGNPGQQSSGPAPGAATQPAAAARTAGTSRGGALLGAAAPAVVDPADGPLETRAAAALGGTASGRQSLLGTHDGAGPEPPGGGPAPLQPLALLAVFAAALVLLLVRVISLPRRTARRIEIRVRPLAGDAQIEAAVEAALRLCESLLPEGTSVSRRSQAALALRPGAHGTDGLDAALAGIARRARRVGIELQWAGAPEGRRQLVPA